MRLCPLQALKPAEFTPFFKPLIQAVLRCALKYMEIKIFDADLAYGYAIRFESQKVQNIDFEAIAAAYAKERGDGGGHLCRQIGIGDRAKTHAQ